MSLDQAEKDRFFELICKMSFLDAAEMKARVEEELDIEFSISTTIQQPNVVAMAYAAPFGRTGGTAPEPVYDITLANAGVQRIAVMRLIRKLFHTLLKEAKEIVDRVPTQLTTGLTLQEAEEIKHRFNNIGAEIDIETRWK